MNIIILITLGYLVEKFEFLLTQLEYNSQCHIIAAIYIPEFEVYLEPNELQMHRLLSTIWTYDEYYDPPFFDKLFIEDEDA